MTDGKHTHTDRCLGIVLQGVYDGVAYWECDDGQERHRFPPDSPLAKRIAAVHRSLAGVTKEGRR